MGMIKCAGHMWSPQLVGWGRPGPNPTRELLGYYAGKLTGKTGKGALSAEQRRKQTLDFWSVPGVYILYKGDAVVYVGQATCLGDRLFDHHRNDHLVGRWDSFSWVSTRAINEVPDGTAPGVMDRIEIDQQPPLNVDGGTLEQWLTELEAFAILAARPVDNRQVPNFGNHTWWFLQIRSEHADLSTEEMIELIYEKLYG